MFVSAKTLAIKLKMIPISVITILTTLVAVGTFDLECLIRTITMENKTNVTI